MDDEATYVAKPEQLSTNSFAQLDPDSTNVAPRRSQPALHVPGQRPEAEESTTLDTRAEDMWSGNATLDENGDRDRDGNANAKRDAGRHAARDRGRPAPNRVARGHQSDDDEATNIVASDTLDTGDITDAGAVPAPAEIGATAEELDEVTNIASRQHMRSTPDRKSKYLPSLAGPSDKGDAPRPKDEGKGTKPEDPLLGKILDGRYQVVERVGMGGMGSVYRGRHVTINKDVAIKVLAPQLAEWPIYVERFLQEARAASMLRHPNVVTITDFGFVEAGNLPYFVMEYLEGEDLRDRLQRVGRMSWFDARAIVLQMCSALDSAHRKGVIHRDIKPENCFLLSQDDDIELVKLVDFGIAKVASDNEAASLTSHGVVLGTVEYISPERANKQQVDARADIYSLGVLIYRMLTGRTPFYGEPVAVVTSHVYDPPPPLRKVAPDAGISPELEAIVLKTLAKRPEDRFQTVAELATALQGVPIPGVDVLDLPGFQRAKTMPPLLPGASATSLPAYNLHPAHNPYMMQGPGGYAMAQGYAARAPRSKVKILVGVVLLLLLVLVIVWSAIESSGESSDESGGSSEPGEADAPDQPTSQLLGPDPRAGFSAHTRAARGSAPRVPSSWPPA